MKVELSLEERHGACSTLVSWGWLNSRNSSSFSTPTHPRLQEREDHEVGKLPECPGLVCHSPPGCRPASAKIAPTSPQN
jgi:hypothetical protein